LRATLLGSLERQRASFAWKCAGLDVTGLRAKLAPSPITLGGLLIAADGLGQLCQRAWPDGRAPSLRRLLIDMIEEYARHVGHADLMRESVDGLVGEDPPGQPFRIRGHERVGARAP
jgi:hypothetical protein